MFVFSPTGTVLTAQQLEEWDEASGSEAASQWDGEFVTSPRLWTYFLSDL
jgi:hypothetical protein